MASKIPATGLTTSPVKPYRAPLKKPPTPPLEAPSIGFKNIPNDNET